MQTPKARTNSSEVPRKLSPRSSSLEVPNKTSPRAVSSEGSQKVSPRVVRQLKHKSPRVDERKAPHSPISEKPRPTRIDELESQISQFQGDLEKLKDELRISEATRKQSQEDADNSKKQMLAMLAEIEESHKRFAKHSATAGIESSEVQKVSEKQDQQLLSSDIEPMKEQSTLDSAIIEIQELKNKLEIVVTSEASQTKQAENAQSEVLSLKENLVEALVLMEDLKDQLQKCKKSEAEAKALATETLTQLETAKSSVEALRLEGINSKGDFDAMTSNLEQSREKMNALEDLVNKFTASEAHMICTGSQTMNILLVEKGNPNDGITEELHAVNSEVLQLRSALEAAAIRLSEKRNLRAVEMRNAQELVEKIKSISSSRENELETRLKESKDEIDNIKTNLMDKETELQGICEENDFLNTRLDGVVSGQVKYELEKEIEKSWSDIENLKAKLMDKDAQLQNLFKENETLKLGMNKNDVNWEKLHVDIGAEMEAAQMAEREALMKVGHLTEEIDKSNRKVTRVSEQLDAAQAARAELEAELKRLKVQTNQWQKAAEAAAAMVSSENNLKCVERTGSIDIHYSPGIGKVGLPYMEDIEGDYLKRKNSNMFKKIGVLWKKPQR